MTTENDPDQDFILHEVTHYQQRYNWDCGVTCVLMLLTAAQQADFIRNFTEICEEEGFGKSTWTIDLCYLLKRFAIPPCMYTTMMGVNEEYSKQNYYDKIIDLDRDRVQRRFASAAADGIAVAPRGLGDRELASQLARGPLLLLVDAGLLACDLCKHNKLKFEFRRCFGGGYRGHYIVAVGRRGGRVLFRDPALSPRVCAAPAQRLLRAHRALGTDQDAVIIHKNYR